MMASLIEHKAVVENVHPFAGFLLLLYLELKFCYSFLFQMVVAQLRNSLGVHSWNLLTNKGFHDQSQSAPIHKDCLVESLIISVNPKGFIVSHPPIQSIPIGAVSSSEIRSDKQDYLQLICPRFAFVLIMDYLQNRAIEDSFRKQNIHVQKWLLSRIWKTIVTGRMSIDHMAVVGNVHPVAVVILWLFLESKFF